MYGYLVQLGLSDKEAEKFWYLLSYMVNQPDTDILPLKAFKFKLEEIYNFDK